VAAGAIEEQVQALLELHRAELEQLVDQALEAELARLVDERIQSRDGQADLIPPGGIKSNGHVRPEDVRADSAAVKVCSGCQRALPIEAFERHRSRCRQCRRDQQRARTGHDHAQAAAEPPRTG
jgi:hypothetical protein